MKPYLPIHRQQIDRVEQLNDHEPVADIHRNYRFVSQQAIRYYLFALIICNVLFFNKILLPLFWLSGIVCAVGFFYYSSRLVRKWSAYTEGKFERKLFRTALIVRVIWVLVSYLMYNFLTGKPFEWGAADSTGYHGEAEWLADLIQQNNLETYYKYIAGSYSDMGYAYFLGWQYWITGKSILIARLIKTVYSAYTCVLIYKLAKRNFGENTGRMAGIFAMIYPNLILYTGLHLKETEMLFLSVAFLERTDKLIREKIFSFSTLSLPILFASLLFFFRTVLGVTALFSLFSALTLTSTKILGMGKRFILILWILLASSYFIGGRVLSEIEETWNTGQKQQATSMQYRTDRENGNKFAKYMGAAVFAPMIFVIPFPTMINTPDQQNQQFINGGNYIKNILGFFIILAAIVLVKQRIWREHLLLISFLVGYLAVLANSAFAQAERFHQPALPIEIIFAAFGICNFERLHKKYFNWWLFFILFVIVGWSWFKLAGRGMA